MASLITDQRRGVLVTAVRDIRVTDIVSADGTHRRAIRIYGEPVANGQPAEILEVIVEALDRTALEMDAPAQAF